MDDLEEKSRVYQALAMQIQKLEEQKRALGQEILALMSESELYFPHFTVKRYQRLNIKTTLEEARAFNATHMEEVVDKEKLKSLLSSGLQIPNTSTTHYIIVSKSPKSSS